MRVSNINEFTGGWFVGAFTPAVHQTGQFEVGFHRYEKDQAAPPHYHCKTLEINLLIRGQMSVNGLLMGSGTIFVIEPYEVAEAKFLTECELVIVKVPSVPGDKVLVQPNQEAGQ